MSSDLFLIGASGTRAYRAAMGAVAENISNAGTENYNRRTVSTRESVVSGATQVLYRANASFGGTEVAGVNRANDPYLDATARLTGATLANANTRLRFGNDIELAINDTESGVGQLMSDMFGSITQLAANPSDPTLRTNMLYGIERVVTAFHQSAQELQSVSDSIATTAENETTALNDALAELGRVNANLLRSKPGTSNFAQLLDSRDAALSAITKRADVTISFADNGTAGITYNGATVVDGPDVTNFGVTANADGTLAFTLGGTATTAPTTGALGGLTQSATATRQRRDSLDALAVQFADDMNTWHAAGTTNAGAAGAPLLTVGTTAASLTQAVTNIADIATRSSDGTLNGNLLTISTVRGAGSVEYGWTALVAGHANQLNTIKSEQAAAESRDTQARQARENVSGVDLDTEAADLLRFQQAYSGCAKIIQVARETFDSILAIL